MPRKRFGRGGTAEGEPEYLFGMVIGAARLSGGHIVVADMRSPGRHATSVPAASSPLRYWRRLLPAA